MRHTEKRRYRYIYDEKASFYTKKANPSVRECIVRYVIRGGDTG